MVSVDILGAVLWPPEMSVGSGGYARAFSPNRGQVMFSGHCSSGAGKPILRATPSRPAGFPGRTQGSCYCLSSWLSES